ncbi:MAG: FAD:protein FMN transferase [Myxococcales bacterium]|nr:FAD:protein FMN transferase [Myxococcales bacterium]
MVGKVLRTAAIGCAALVGTGCRAPGGDRAPPVDAGQRIARDDLAAPAGPPHLVARAGEAMGTVVEIKVWTPPDRDPAARAAIGEAFAEIARLEGLMTTWKEDSDIARLNAAAGVAPVAVAKETLECVERSLDFSRRSGGAFDITFYALKGLWKFDHDLEAKLPDAKELKRRLPLIDYRKLEVDRGKSTLFLRERGMKVNLGGIAKGYAVDRATAILRKSGFADAIVQAGGDLMLSGSKSGEPWQAGIRDPRGAANSYFAVAAVKDHAFSTAGDYERFFFLGGKRYHHIIDPKTGWPATRARSVTIYAPDALTADGLDDAVLILGVEEGLKMIEALPGVGAVVVDRDNRVHMSKSLRGIVEITRPPTPGP